MPENHAGSSAAGARALFLFKLRRNITLEGDLLLARMEMEALLPEPVRPVPCIETRAGEHPELSGFKGLAAPGTEARTAGVQGFTAHAPLAVLPDLIRRVSFIQQIYGIVPRAPETERWLRELDERVGPVLTLDARERSIVFLALPHYLLFELSDPTHRRSADGAETVRNLEAVRDALLGWTEDRAAAELARKALVAPATTSHLSHGLHYYKAKFFPRLARSLLNVCSQDGGVTPPRVLDNFAGSGTTLVEAATLRLPAVGVDIDPLSVLISSAKLDWLNLEHSLLEHEGARITRRLSQNRREAQQAQPLPAMTPLPDWLMKNRKMSGDLSEQLRREMAVLRHGTDGCDPLAQSVLRAMASDAITRKVRLRFLGTGVGRFSLTVVQTPMSELFLRSLRQGVKAVAAWEWLRTSLRLHIVPGEALVGDARRLPEGLGGFDLLLTSPPYLPASSGRESYAKAHALSLLALGMKDGDAVADLECATVGAVSCTSEEDSEFRGLSGRERELVEWLRGDDLRALKAGPTARYFLDMRQAFGEMHRALKPGARAVVVSGKRSTFYTFTTREPLYVVPCAEMLAEGAEAAGFEVEALHDLQLQKANRNARPRSLDDYYETLIMLRKADDRP